MRTIRIQTNFIFILMLSGTLARASVLSSQGLGEPIWVLGARSFGMGGVSASLADEDFVSWNNPAALSFLKGTRLSLQFLYENNHFQDPDGKATYQFMNFEGFQFVLPFGSGTGFSASLTPVTRVQYHFLSTGISGDLPFEQVVEGEGGINSFSLGGFIAPIRQFSLGASVQYLFGKIKESWEINYNLEDFDETTDRFYTWNWGIGLRVGMMIKPSSFLTLGGTYTLPVSLNNETSAFFEQSQQQLEEEEGTILIPSQWNVSACLTPSKILTFGFEYGRQSWDELEINEEKLTNTIRSNRFSFGIEFFSLRGLGLPFHKRMAYRVGYSQQPYMVEDINGQPIQEHWFTLGVGIPMFLDASQFDIALGFGRRGSLDKNELTENLFRLNITFTSSEQWFLRRY